MMRIAVCDDNADFLLSEITMIEKWSEQSGIPVEIYRFDNGDSLIAKNASVGMDIIFLQARQCGKNSFPDLLAGIRPRIL